MVVYSLERAPQRLRGLLSRYCLEVRAGLFVGRADARMRELLWEKVQDWAAAGTHAVMIWREPTEQGYAFRTLGTNRRVPVKVDGIWLVMMAEAGIDAAAVECDDVNAGERDDDVATDGA